jgi:hypothetical protein
MGVPVRYCRCRVEAGTSSASANSRQLDHRARPSSTADRRPQAVTRRASASAAASATGSEAQPAAEGTAISCRRYDSTSREGPRSSCRIITSTCWSAPGQQTPVTRRPSSRTSHQVIARWSACPSSSGADGRPRWPSGVVRASSLLRLTVGAVSPLYEHRGAMRHTHDAGLVRSTVSGRSRHRSPPPPRTRPCARHGSPGRPATHRTRRVCSYGPRSRPAC